MNILKVIYHCIPTIVNINRDNDNIKQLIGYTVCVNIKCRSNVLVFVFICLNNILYKYHIFYNILWHDVLIHVKLKI